MNDPQALIVAAMRAGVLLIANGQALRFKALNPIPAELAEQIKSQRAAILALLKLNTSRQQSAALMRALRRQGDNALAISLRDAWRERLAICLADGIPLPTAEHVACEELKMILASKQVSVYTDADVTDHRSNQTGDPGKWLEPLPDCSRNRDRRKRAIEADERKTKSQH